VEFADFDTAKERLNIEKHRVSFKLAKVAFNDPFKIIVKDEIHSQNEKRFFCYGIVEGNVLTVRFTYRNGKPRIFGAAYWRKGREIYEKKNRL
jgi:hypothetical protein